MFDTTARLATEEQGLPACLPLVSFTGSERATMQFTTNSGLVATFIQEGAQPTISIEKVPGVSGTCVYHATSFLEAAACNSKFVIAPGFDDEEPYFLEPHEVSAIAYMARARTNPRLGSFQMKWVPHDPSAPF